MRALHALAGLALGTVLGAAVVGCSSSEEKAETPTKQQTSAVPVTSEPPAETPLEVESEPPAPAAALEAAYRSYVDAFLTGDGATAYALLSERCQGEQPLSEFAATVEAAGELYGPVEYSIDSVDVDGDRGKVDATYPVEALNQGGGSEWAMQDGQWRMDRC